MKPPSLIPPSSISSPLAFLHPFLCSKTSSSPRNIGSFPPPPSSSSSPVKFSFDCYCQTSVVFRQTDTTALLPSLLFLLPLPCWIMFLLQMVLRVCCHWCPFPSLFSSFWWGLCCSLSFALFVIFLFSRFNSTCEESLLVISGVGLQLRNTRRSGSCRYYFVDASQLEQVVINEGVVGLQVLYYLAFIVTDADRMIIPFQCFPPRLPTLTFIYNIVYSLLFLHGSLHIPEIDWRNEPNRRMRRRREGTELKEMKDGEAEGGEEIRREISCA
eukprot:GHVS01075964.1.p1 GENE.GHVS01075964.1~~GHVS01075964.1.p1  ORF type:complete len:271 (-),score=55.76 GHVS01075964.1:381-1193(-)